MKVKFNDARIYLLVMSKTVEVTVGPWKLSPQCSKNLFVLVILQLAPMDPIIR